MLNFKNASLNDIIPLADFINQAYRGDYAKKGWTTEADILDGQRTDAEDLQEIITTPSNQILLAFEDEELVGCVHLHFENSDSLYFGMLTVEPSKQSLGIGKKLILHIEEIARQKKIKELRISVIPLRSELIAYYERRGFQKTGRFEPFPSDPRYGIPKTSELRLDEYIKKL